jgi:hypothetical protein
LRQLINNFINNIQDLANIESGLVLIKYHIEHNDPSDDLDFVNEAYDKICLTNQQLIKTIRKYLKIKEGDVLSEQFLSEISSISNNITSIIQEISHIKESNIPGKSEMVGILESCAATFSTKSFIEIFSVLNGNKSNFCEQILILEDKCDQAL